MLPQTKIEILLKDGDKIIGYYQYKENRQVFISPYSTGNYVFGVPSKDIKEIRSLCLES